MTTPSPEELARVGAYWQDMQDLLCEHPEITLTDGEVTCSSCQQTVRMMSDVQLRDIVMRTVQRQVREQGLPRGLCADRKEHPPHEHYSRSLGTYWCTGDPSTRRY